MAIIAVEKWKPVVGHETLYEVSDYGNVRSLSGYRGVNMWGAPCFLKGRVLNPCKNRKGYLSIQIKRKTLLLHRLIALAFFICENPHELQINHIDCDKTNNCIENLEWCDNDYNHSHAMENNRYDVVTGVNNKRAVLNPEKVIEIRKLLETSFLTETEIANMYNVTRSCIACIRHGRTWKKVINSIKQLNN